MGERCGGGVPAVGFGGGGVRVRRIDVLVLAGTLLVAGCAGTAAGHGKATAAVVCQSVTEGVAPAALTAVVSAGGTPVQLVHGQSLAQVFTAASPFTVVAVESPTWITTGSGYTLTLHQGAGLGGPVVACGVYPDVLNNSWVPLKLPAKAQAGVYTLEMDKPTGTAQVACPGFTSLAGCGGLQPSTASGGFVGWYRSNSATVSGGYAMVGGQKASGGFTLEYGG